MTASDALSFKGYERLPKGKLLEQWVEIGGRMGFAYERCIGYDKDFHTHDRLNLAFPRGSCVVKIKTSAPAKTYCVDQSTFLALPSEVEHNHLAKTAIYDTVALYPSDGYCHRLFSALGFSESRIDGFLRSTKLFKRTALLDEFVSTYLLLRISHPKATPALLQKYERHILEEIAHIVFEIPRSRAHDRAEDGSTGLTRALTFIEANLFQNFSAKDLARQSGSSVATLFRYFAAELDMTPFEYIRNRRLDEARKLLASGKHKVSAAAFLVGYEDLSAFSKAFKKRFGNSPSHRRS